jgi:peptide/nickel transport system permease protein
VATHETHPEIISSAAGFGAAAAGDHVADIGELEPVKARGYWEQVWLRFKRDKAAIIGAFTIVFLILVSFVGAPIAQWILGHGPNKDFPLGIDPNTTLPYGPWTHFVDAPYLGATGHFPSVFFLLGSDGLEGRDEFLRLLYGGQASLEVAIFATLLSMVIGVTMGALAGYFGGWIDMIVSRLTEFVMAFPILLFVIALSAIAGERLNGITFGFLGRGVFTLVIVLGLFGWFYPARIVRAQVLSLREKEFIEAARMVGASDARIIRSHLLPHLVAPVIVIATISVAQNILAEAGLSFLGIGIQNPTASWGSLLATAPQFYLQVPWLMLWPGLMILITTLAFNLLGDGLRDAFDPRSTH